MSDLTDNSTTALERANIPLPKFLKKNHYFGFLGILLVYLLAGTYSEYSQTIMNTIIFAIIGIVMGVIGGGVGGSSWGKNDK